ncbi:MAG TPA: MAPEG family protein [Nannocystis exedens]|nr:MAPEG family protein [Nannocystis exedens]
MSDAFFVYGITTLILCLNVTMLWLLSGSVRYKSKTTHNPEDAASVAKGADVRAEDPEAVARVLRAHTNTFANTVPFLFLGQVYVAAGASATMAWVFLGAFTAARVIYSVCYLGGLQPWRSLSFGVGVLATFGMIVHLAILLLG